MLSATMDSSSSMNTIDDTQEGFPSDPASTTPQLLSALWDLISQGCRLPKGESMTILTPNMESELTPSYMERLMAHFDVCKDVCDDFGISTILSPYVNKSSMGRNTVIGFTVKSYKTQKTTGAFTSDADDMEFDFDPFWDLPNDHWDGIKEIAALHEQEDEEMMSLSSEGSSSVAAAGDGNNAIVEELPEIVNPIPADDDEIITITKVWTNKMMSDLGICPFTNGAEKAGLPMGKVFYCVDRNDKMEDVYARYWKEVIRVEQSNEKDLSTTLLIIPEFCINNVELFENFSNSLTDPLESLHVEDLLQLVFFHPEWTFRDGGARSGDGAAANYARRSPWPMINILRTNQVRAGQRGIPTGLVYQQNEKTLRSVGSHNLEKMLRLRDWTEIEGMKVDRKDMEALRVAQDLQSSGDVAVEDATILHDDNLAANKVSEREIEGGDMVNVINQALERRLSGGADNTPKPLSGSETSAAMMASDFLLDYLKNLKTQ